MTTTLFSSGRAALAILLLPLMVGCTQASEEAPTPDPISPPYTVRVLVLNINKGKDASGARSLDRVVELIREARADVVLLQEVDSVIARSGNVDQTAYTARATGMHGRFGNSLAYPGGGYGVATLSRWPVEDTRLIRLPVDPPQLRAGAPREPRAVLAVTVLTPGGALHVLNAHLDPTPDDHWRRQEANAVVGVSRSMATTGAPVLLGGDFNAVPESAVLRGIESGGLRDLWPGCGRGRGSTTPARLPRKRVDYLFAAGASVRCVEARVLRNQLSDHRAVLFTVVVADS